MVMALALAAGADGLLAAGCNCGQPAAPAARDDGRPDAGAADASPGDGGPEGLPDTGVPDQPRPDLWADACQALDTCGGSRSLSPIPITPYAAKSCGTGCKQVTFGNFVELDYSVSGSYLAYIGQVGGGNKVYLVDLAKGTEVLLRPYSGWFGCNRVATDGKKLVYTCVRSCYPGPIWKRSVTLFDPQTSVETDLACIDRRASDSPCFPTSIALGTTGIGLTMSMTSCIKSGAHLYRFATGSIDDVGQQQGGIWRVRMSGTRMAWTQWTAAWKADQIVVYDTATGSPQRVDPHNGADQYYPRIHGTQVVWTDHRNGPGGVTNPANSDIYYHDLATGKTTQVTTDLGTQEMPDVWGDWVVWMDWRNNPGGYSRGGKAPNCDVYGKNIKTGQEVQLAGGPGHQAYPRVDNDRVFYTDLDAKYNVSVFMIDLKQRFGR
jgi:beta propeller repeat protein